MQQYIEAEIENAKRAVSNRQSNERKFETSKLTDDATYFDVPIKIEENGEGFTPPSQIR